MAPVYEYLCDSCGKKLEDYRPVRECDAQGPVCCGAPSRRILSLAGMALLTKGGNWSHVTPAAGMVTKGNRKPKTIGRGHGLGGRRPPPTIRKEGNSTFTVETKK